MLVFEGIKVIVFDFDGTLVQSNELKREAFFQLFAKKPKCVKILDDVLGVSSALSRCEIIEAVLKKSDFTGDIQEEKGHLVQRYGAIVLTAVKQCPEIEGSTELLQRLQGQYYPLYLSSMTPRGALLETMQYRGLVKYFKEIYGYPSKKENSLKEILSQEDITREQLLVIGDGESDASSALANGCLFFDLRQHQLAELLL